MLPFCYAMICCQNKFSVIIEVILKDVSTILDFKIDKFMQSYGLSHKGPGTEAF